VHPNAGATGYYRWLLPSTGLNALLASGWRTISRAERISAASAVVSGARDAVLPVDRALALASRFARDDEPGVVASADGLLDYAWNHWTSEADRPLLEARMRALLRPALQRIGFSPRPGETNRQARLRQHLVGTLALHAGDQRGPLAGRASGPGLDRHRRPSPPGGGEPDLRDVCLAAAGRTGDAALFDRGPGAAQGRREDGTDRNALVLALSSFRQPELRQRARALTSPRSCACSRRSRCS
jgi:alanyl aminopeptidase